MDMPLLVVQKHQDTFINVSSFISSAEAEFSCHHQHVEERAPLMCYYMRRRADGAGSLPPETKDVLQHRLDPSVRQPSRCTVEALLYTPGSQCAVCVGDLKCSIFRKQHDEVYRNYNVKVL